MGVFRAFYIDFIHQYNIFTPCKMLFIVSLRRIIVSEVLLGEHSLSANHAHLRRL